MAGIDRDSDTAQLPEDLPPVTPPSAGFIVQLFVVPGLIVVAIVAVWLLFGKLAAPDTDWRGQLVELQHPNEHRRWRGALGLAQMLKSDEDLGEEGQHLSRNRELAQALADVLQQELKKPVQGDDDEQKYQAFLARTLGLFDLPEAVFPALEQALSPGIDREVRKNAIGAIAVITDRMTTAGRKVPADRFVEAIVQISTEDDPLIRQLCAYTLGLFSQPAALDRLEVLLEDSDRDTRINAAVGLARQGDPRCAGVLAEALADSSQPVATGSSDEYKQFLVTKNALAAVEKLAGRLSDDRRSEIIALIEPLAREHREPKIRTVARTTLDALKKPAEN